MMKKIVMHQQIKGGVEKNHMGIRVSHLAELLAERVKR